MSATEKYPHNVLEGFGNGCLLDLRVRLAMNVLQHNQSAVTGDPEADARYALDLAGQLMEQAKDAGLIEPLPQGTEIGEVLRAQAQRTAQYSVLQQIAGQRAAMDEQAKVVPAAPLLDPRKH